MGGGNPTLYGYVRNHNAQIDAFGLAIFYHAGKEMDGPIDLTKGRPDLDFNPAGKGGFYVTTDIEQAKEWLHPEKRPVMMLWLVLWYRTLSG